MARRNNGPRIKWYPKRGAYYIVWSQDGRSKERSTGTRDRDEAEAQLVDFLEDRRREEKLIPANKLLVTEVLDPYLTEVDMAASSKARAAHAVVVLIKFWEGMTVAEVDKDSCAKYKQWRGKADGTVRKELGVLRAAINHAADSRRLKDRVKVFLPGKPEPRQRWLKREEAAALLRAALRLPKSRSYLPLFIVIALHTGQRKSAILGLRWSQIDLKRRRIDWRDPELPANNNKVRPHTRMPRKLYPHLKRAHERRGTCEYVVHLDGRPLRDVKSSFMNACRKALLSGVSPHTLRHTRATWGMQAGANKWELAGFLGMTLETLETVYGKHHPDYQKEGADRYGPSRGKFDEDD